MAWNSQLVRTIVCTSMVVAFPNVSLSENCAGCTPVLRMTEARGECIQKRFSEFAAEAERSALGVVFFDVDKCTLDGEVATRAVAGEMDGEPAQPAELDRTVILDANGLVCLRRLMDETTQSLDPEILFDLAASC